MIRAIGAFLDALRPGMEKNIRPGLAFRWMIRIVKRKADHQKHRNKSQNHTDHGLLRQLYFKWSFGGLILAENVFSRNAFEILACWEQVRAKPRLNLRSGIGAQ